MYVVGHDVQELKSAQEQLRAREEELRFFAENIPEAIVYIDLERGCTFVNNVFLATRGFTREFLLGKFPKDVYGARGDAPAAAAPRPRDAPARRCSTSATIAPRLARARSAGSA